jgi:hypothetical protein
MNTDAKIIDFKEKLLRFIVARIHSVGIAICPLPIALPLVLKQGKNVLQSPESATNLSSECYLRGHQAAIKS